MKINFKIWLIVLSLASLSELSFAQSNVWISGKLLTDQKEGSIPLSNDSFILFPHTIISSADIDKSGNFHLEFNVSKSQVIQIFNHTFYITPGDSVFVNVTGSRYMPEKLEFRGRNADHYNYSTKYTNLKRSIHFKYFTYDLKNGLTKYLDSITVNKNILLKNLNDFSNNHTLTTDFKAYAISQIIYDYYDQMLSPFVNKKYSIEQIPSSYLSILDQIKLTDDNLVDKREYAFTAMDLLKYKKLKSNDDELKLINDNFSGLTKEFILSYYADKLILSYTSKDSLVTKELFKKIDTELTKTEFRNYFNTSRDRLHKSLTPFPKEVLLTALTDSVGQKLIFKDLLTKSKNKMIVLDFWASWCGSCIQGMPEVNKMKKNFSNADVEFVFISLDKTEPDWRGGLNKTKIPGNHYWIKDNFDSALAKYLIIHSIPRYVIINKAGQIEKIEAFSPYPGDYGLETQLNKLLTH